MAKCNINFTNLLFVEKPTDMEIAIYILRFMDDGSNELQSYKDHGYRRDYIVKLAEEALKTIVNPHAKKLLLDKIR